MCSALNAWPAGWLLPAAACTASMNERVADTLAAFDPRLGAIFNASTDGINSVLRNIGTAQQDAVERYFRATNSRLVRARVCTAGCTVCAC